MISQLLQDNNCFTCPFSETKQVKPLTSCPLPVPFTLTDFPDWEVILLSSPSEIKVYARELNELNNFWLNECFLDLLQRERQGVIAGAMILRHQDGTTIIVSTQVFRFSAGNQIRQPGSVEGKVSFRRRLSNLFSFPILTLGQFMVSGRDGWSGQPETVSPNVTADLLHAAAEAVAKRMGFIPAILIKDLALLNSPIADAWRDKGYYQLPVDPSMQLPVRNWKSIEDYLIDISSKYRVRYRRARKMAEAVECRELDNLEVQRRADQLYQLYQNIKAEAAFDAISLSPNYFAELKERFPDTCRIYGYFHQGELIGFRSTLANGDVLHAHYLGFEQGLNRELHLYHNILFDLLKEAIDGGYQKLDYGRTALEIKSTIGAEPVHYFCSLRGRNALVRWVIRRFTPALFRATEWQQRRPFKG